MTSMGHVSTKATAPLVVTNEDVSPGINPDEYNSLMNEFLNNDIYHSDESSSSIEKEEVLNSLADFMQLND
jgi:hypothetical protein